MDVKSTCSGAVIVCLSIKKTSFPLNHMRRGSFIPLEAGRTDSRLRLLHLIQAPSRPAAVPVSVAQWFEWTVHPGAPAARTPFECYCGTPEALAHRCED